MSFDPDTVRPTNGPTLARPTPEQEALYNGSVLALCAAVDAYFSAETLNEASVARGQMVALVKQLRGSSAE